jgi:mRNA-degrading endonuclease RelE of RelBE toxin-antitoxin system
MISILQTPTFKKQVKKLHKNKKQELDEAIKKIIKDPSIGDLKKGDLSRVQVYKFKIRKQLTLVAYEFDEDELKLLFLALGSHENFYRDLKR